MKKLILPWLVFFVIGIVYLSIPSPRIPELSEATKSQEPGDTWQNPNTMAFFTDKQREQVINEYRNAFRLDFFGYKLPNLRLNYRPEDTATYVRKHIDSYYLEEIVIPFRESIFINGWDPKKSPTLAHLSPKELETTKIIIDGVEYQSKITTRWYQSNMIYRLIVFILFWIITPIAIYQMAKSINDIKSILLNLWKTR